MKLRTLFSAFLLLFASHFSDIQAQTLADTLETRLTEIAINGGDLVLQFQVFDKASTNKLSKKIPVSGHYKVTQNGVDEQLKFTDGTAYKNSMPSGEGRLYLVKTPQNELNLFHVAKRANRSIRLRRIPLWLSILPPLIAIIFALIFREVVVSLFLGLLSGSFIAGGLRIDSFYYFFRSILQTIETYIVGALADGGHLAVIVFSLLIGGMVAIISRNGGMAGVVKSLSRYAKDPFSAQLITWFLGLIIFFDDYTNTLIVGNTMRSVTDRFRISREKLAYIVDSTAAPVTSIAFITTWIGAELGYIDDGIQQLANFDTSLTPYALFLASLKYSFYPILTLGFMLLLIYSRRDYGEMYQAEVRTRKTGQVKRKVTEKQNKLEEIEDLSPIEGASLKWYNAAIPVAVVILMTLFGLWDTGMTNTYNQLTVKGLIVPTQSYSAIWAIVGADLGAESTFFMKLGVLIGNADSYIALLWASLSGVLVAVALTVVGRIMKLSETMSSLVTGFKAMLPALIILTLAWALATTTQELYTADFLTSALQDSINPYLMPVLIFILAATIAFSTGSSWSTMAILYPIAIPTTWAVCAVQGVPLDISLEILLNVIATTLAASVLGDHCSPISDTTILSSLASDCNHIDHVRTQLPYALTVGTVSLIAGGLATFFGGGWLVSGILLLVSFVLLWAIIRYFGKLVD